MSERVSVDALAAAVRSGASDIGALWPHVQPFIRFFSTRWLAALTAKGGPRGLAVDDLTQEGYLALLEAVQTFDPAQGPFVPWLGLYLRKRFAEAAGLRGRRDPLDDALSLDVPVSDEDETPRADMLQDPADGFLDADARIFQDQLHDALERALDGLPDAASAAVLRGRYWQGQTLSDLAKVTGRTPQNVAQRERDALSRLRHSSARRELEQFLDERTDFFAGVGVGAFRVSGSSSVERAALRRERLSSERVHKKDGGAGL